MKPLPNALGILLTTGALAFGQATTNSFFNWETPPVHPVALSPDGTRLVVCNLPDNRLEVFELTAGGTVAVGSVPVGLDPCSVRFRTTNEVWVVNFISDSVSVISLAEMRVVATLGTSNEPSDIVFAGSPARAFVSCAQPGIVQVFNPTNRALITNLVMEGSRPKAMATRPDGREVYVAIFESGNASTILGAGVSLGFPLPTPVDFPDGPYGGINPPPNNGTNFLPALNPALPTNSPPPRTGLIVKKNGAGRWMDDNSGDWTGYIRGTNAVFSDRIAGWDLPDHDVAIINTTNLSLSYASGLMNICMDVSVNPASGKITVVGTDAINQVRFEPALKGIFTRVEFAEVDPVALTNRVRDLNPHLDYLTATLPQPQREKSIGDPRGMVWSADGTRGYVTGMGSDNLIVIDSSGQRVATNAVVELGQGPTGMALDEPRNRLYVLNRFSATISVVDTVAGVVVDTVPMFDPTPLVIKQGRPQLYDTHKTSGLGQAACGSCHLDARTDRLAWDLGDQTGSVKFITNGNFGRFPPSVTNHFHPMKGPTTTQTLQDIIAHEPFHWRGDRDGLEQFDQTFTNLQGAVNGLTTNEMKQFKEFLATVRFPPNPFRTLSNTLPTNLPIPGHVALGHGTLPAGSQLPNGNAQNGMIRFRLQGTTGCIHCHTLPSGVGTDMRWNGFQWLNLPTGPHGERHAAFSAIERSSILPFKIVQLRNLYDKIGMDLTRTNSRSGFGFLHDGSVDSLVRFVQDSFDLRNDQETADLTAFLLAFTGSDLPAGVLNDPDRPPGLSSLDTHAAVGRQITINSGAIVPLLDSMIAIAHPLTSRVDLVVKGSKDGLGRGWFYNRTNALFQSDRRAETVSPTALRQLAGVGNELTYTVVPRDSGRRIGVDRDEDGYFDRDELDFGSDPTSPLSLATNRPPVLSGLPNQTIFAGQKLELTATATDFDIPAQQLTFALTNAPAGATIDATDGVFNWTPGADQAPSTNSITVVVTDSGMPQRSASGSFDVLVIELHLSAVTLTTNDMTLSWRTLPGQNHRIQYKDHLDDSAWIDLHGNFTFTNGFGIMTDSATHQQRFYRLVLEE